LSDSGGFGPLGGPRDGVDPRGADPIGQMFSALADPSRRHVLDVIGERGTVTATELTGDLPISRQAVAKHLATLAEAGLVEGTRQGRETRYRLTLAGEEWDDRLDALRLHLERRRTDAPDQDT
jgi:DNA-binding transcriptional ArsR family regulator